MKARVYALLAAACCGATLASVATVVLAHTLTVIGNMPLGFA